MVTPSSVVTVGESKVKRETLRRVHSQASCRKISRWEFVPWAARSTVPGRRPYPEGEKSSPSRRPDGASKGMEIARQACRPPSVNLAVRAARKNTSQMSHCRSFQ